MVTIVESLRAAGTIGGSQTDNPPKMAPRNTGLCNGWTFYPTTFQRLRYTLFCGSQVHIAGVLNARFEDLGDVVRGSLERTIYEMNDPI
jgi:hypothetical protein